MRTEQKTGSSERSKDEVVRRLALAGVFAAITFVAFTFLSIPVPTPGGGKVTVHVGNAFCVLGSLLLGSYYGGLGGAVGLTLADVIDPMYVSQAPITFILKAVMGLIAGELAHRVFRLEALSEREKILRAVGISSAAALLFNAVFDPICRYFYKLLILGKPAAELSLVINVGVTAINSVVSLLLVLALYMALRGPLRRMGIGLSSQEKEG